MSIVNAFQLVLIRYYKGKKTYQLLKLTFKSTDALIKANEAYMIHSLAQYCSNFEGSYAEVGVYQGASAKIICEAKQDKALFLFDTFEGLPEPGPNDRGLIKGQFKSCQNQVSTLLHCYKNIHIIPGFFPDSAQNIQEKTFCFVHLDTDIYESTLHCLEYFYKRMTKGGIILTHDYAKNITGVKLAYKHFFEDKPENIIELTDTQCMLIKQ